VSALRFSRGYVVAPLCKVFSRSGLDGGFMPSGSRVMRNRAPVFRTGRGSAGLNRIAQLQGRAAIAPGRLGLADAVLISHDRNPDNLDASERAFALAAPRVLTTAPGARQLGPPTTGLRPYEHADVAGAHCAARPGPAWPSSR
jgi:hypothetical protein